MTGDVIFSGLLAVLVLCILSALYSYLGQNKYLKLVLWPLGIFGLAVFSLGQPTETFIGNSFDLSLLLLIDRVLVVLLFFVWVDDFAQAFYGVPSRFQRRRGQ